MYSVAKSLIMQLYFGKPDFQQIHFDIYRKSAQIICTCA